MSRGRFGQLSTHKQFCLLQSITQTFIILSRKESLCPNDVDSGQADLLWLLMATARANFWPDHRIDLLEAKALSGKVNAPLYFTKCLPLHHGIELPS